MTMPQTQQGPFKQLPGGYPGGQLPQQPQPAGQPPMPPGFQQPQQPTPAQPQQQALPWFPPGPVGAPLEGAPPPQFQQQPQPQLPQQQPLPQPQPQGLDLNARLNGPNIPAELQGVTVAQALQYYQGMRSAMLQQYRQTAPQPVAQAPAQPQPQAQTQQGWDWRDPRSGIAQVVSEQLQPVMQSLQPMIMQTQLSAMKAARDQVAAEFGPDFVRIEPQVLQRLQGADPQTLLNPQMWRVAAESVVGQMTLNGQPFNRQAQTPQALQPNQWLQPAQRVGPGQQPLPNLNGFFTEQPNSGASPVGPMQLNPQQQFAASAMGMTTEQYAAWSAGIPGSAR